MEKLMKKNIEGLRPYTVPNLSIHTKLDANENPYNLFGILKEKIIKEIEKLDVNRYPDSDSDELRELLSYQIGLTKENILCGNGSDEVIQIIINTFVDKDDYVVTHSPTFSMYKIFTQIAGGKISEVLSDEFFGVNIEQIIEEANRKKAKIIFLCNPNNPTGTPFSRQDIERIIKSTRSIVIVDEAYYEFLDETVVDLVKEYDRLIVLRTLSKAFGLAGARVGYGVASVNTMGMLYRVKPPYNLNIFSQVAGKIFVENSALVHEYVKKIKDERTYLFDKITNVEGIHVFPTASNFILIKTEKADKILKMAINEGIALRGFKGEGNLKNCIRVSVGTRDENNRFINLLQRVG